MHVAFNIIFIDIEQRHSNVLTEKRNAILDSLFFINPRSECGRQNALKHLPRRKGFNYLLNNEDSLK